RQCDVRDVVHTKVMPSANYKAEHHHQDGKKKDGLPRAKKLNVDKLADVRERLSVLLEADHRKPHDDDPSKIRELKNNWWLKLSVNMQRHADNGNTRSFYESLRCSYGPTY
ncbi:craniofacial development protein 2, partial [Biomphalaria glabrata]